MGAVPQLAYRFLRSKSSDGFIALISWVSVVGVALGVIALIVVTSVINGFESELTRVISGMNGDVVLYSRGSPIKNADYVQERVKKYAPEVTGSSSSLVTELMLSGPIGVAGGVLDGFDPVTIREVTTVPASVIEGRFAEVGAEVALGYILAEKIGATVGSEIRLISPFSNQVTEEQLKRGEFDAPVVIPVRVVGLVKMGMYQYDSKFAFAPLNFIQEQLNETDSVTTFKLKLQPGADSFDVADRLSSNFGYPFRAKNWGQLNKNLFYAIQLEKVVIAIILTAIVIVAAFNVVSTLMMMVHDKARSISILKAMGFRPSQSFLLFVLVGLLIGVVGTVAGLALGLLLNQVVEKGNWIELPSDIYHIDFLPVVVHWNEVGWIVFFAILIGFLATLYPAYRVARRSPLEGLRYE